MRVSPDIRPVNYFYNVGADPTYGRKGLISTMNEGDKKAHNNQLKRRYYQTERKNKEKEDFIIFVPPNQEMERGDGAILSRRSPRIRRPPEIFTIVIPERGYVT